MTPDLFQLADLKDEREGKTLLVHTQPTAEAALRATAGSGVKLEGSAW